MATRIVAHKLTGEILKSFSYDFSPQRQIFHLSPVTARNRQLPVMLQLKDFKAIYFVRSFSGNLRYNEKKAFTKDDRTYGRRMAVTFNDGEYLVGTCTAYLPDELGFFLSPADKASNNERVFAIKDAVTGMAEVND